MDWVAFKDAGQGTTKETAWLQSCIVAQTQAQSVQAWVADEPDDDDLTFVQVTCFACAQAHLVNPKTGKVLGAAEDD